MSGTGQPTAAAQLLGYFNGQAIPLPAGNLYFDLMTTAATNTTPGTPMTYQQYTSRPAYANTSGNFSVNTTANPPVVTNQVAITWPQLGANQAVSQPVVQLCIFGVASGGLPIYFLDIPLAYQKTFTNGDQPSFAPTTMTLAIN